MTTDIELFKQRLKAMKDLLRVLRPERYTYLGACIFFALMFAIVMAKALASGQADVYKTLIPLFGSSGGVVVMIGLSLVVFHRAINIVFAEKKTASASGEKPRGKKAAETKTNTKTSSSEEEEVEA